MTNEPIWKPTDQRVADSNMQRFLVRHADRLKTQDYASLYEWSVTKPGEFWEAVWNFCDIRCTTSYTDVVENFNRMPGASRFTRRRMI